MVVGDMIIASTKRNPIIGVKAGGKGDVTKTHLKWSNDIAPDVPTPVTDGKHLYVLHDDGAMSCLNPETGEPYYKRERLPRGTYSSSPLLADGKIYVTSENAATAVLAAGPEFKLLHTNELDDAWSLSSIAVSGTELFIRTSDALYCISGK
jgi:outer membrane protein assembly factor BamB